MDFSMVSLTEEQKEFASEVERFISSVITPEVIEYEHTTGSGWNESVHRAKAERGWVMPSWPKEHGGAALDPVQVRILELALRRSGYIDIASSTTRLVWSAVERYLEPDFLEELRRGVAAGKVKICLGYTDPNGGSDVANSTLRAAQDGDDWLLNGSKMFTTGAQHAQYTFLITRTDPSAPKHKGLTMFLVPLDSPGIVVQAIHTFGGERTNMVYYDDVRIADRYRVGPVNGGWSVVHGPLDAEHDGYEQNGLNDISIGVRFIETLFVAFRAAVRAIDSEGEPEAPRRIDDRAVLLRIGEIATQLEAALSTPGPMGRVKCSEVLIKCSADICDLVGAPAILSRGEDGSIDDAAIDYAHRFAQGTATYSGTVEVFRNTIARHALGLPELDLPGRRRYLIKQS